MPEWARVLAGCIVLMIIEAGAPVLVIESLHLRQNRQPEVHRAAKQETSGPADQNKNSDATNNPANQSVAIVPPIATQDKQKERDDQRNGREQKSDSFSAL